MTNISHFIEDFLFATEYVRLEQINDWIWGRVGLEDILNEKDYQLLEKQINILEKMQ